MEHRNHYREVLRDLDEKLKSNTTPIDVVIVQIKGLLKEVVEKIGPDFREWHLEKLCSAVYALMLNKKRTQSADPTIWLHLTINSIYQLLEPMDNVSDRHHKNVNSDDIEAVMSDLAKI